MNGPQNPADRVTSSNRPPEGTEVPSETQLNDQHSGPLHPLGSPTPPGEALTADGDIRPEDYVPNNADFLPSPPRRPSPMARFPSARSLRPAAFLLFLCFVISTAQWSHAFSSDGTWASYQTVWGEGQWWRLLTSLLTHANLGHLLSNAPLFLIFGWYLRDFFGFAIFPGTALAIGVLSNAWTLWTYPPDAELLGASGMLYGMVALWLVLYVHFETNYTHAQRVFRAIGVSLLLLFPTTFQQTTSYTAHGFGFTLGIVAGLIVTPWVKIRTRPEA